MAVSFRVDALFSNPKFVVECDRPCRGDGIEFSAHGNSSYSGGYPFTATENPRVLIVTSGSLQLLAPDVTVSIGLRSNDDTPLTSINVKAYVQ
jgi:hypothetical protein